METNQETIKSLNRLLQGEYMAVESFNNFIAKLGEDNQVKSQFQAIQEQHRENITKLATYIQDIGGRPEENLGLKGFMGQMQVSMGLGQQTEPEELIAKAIEGETQGVNMAEKVLRGNLDDKSREIAGEILKKDRNSIDRLQDMKDKIKQKKYHNNNH